MTTIVETEAPIAVATATEADEERVVNLLTNVFARDPVARWMYPQEDEYFALFPRFIRAFAGRAFSEGTAFVAGGGVGAALWLGPGVGADASALVGLIEKTLPDTRRDAVLAMFEQMDGFHPAEPHWHLAVLGVAPVHQGRGIGTRLLRQGLAMCDRRGMPAYLEATTEANARLYGRHGFEEVGSIAAGPEHTVMPMVRRPG